MKLPTNENKRTTVMWNQLQREQCVVPEIRRRTGERYKPAHIRCYTIGQ